jgi:putative transposase
MNGGAAGPVRDSSIGFATPADRHEGRDLAILARRRTLYERAWSVHPERWTRAHRPWKRPAEVLLLPDIQALELDPITTRAE